MEKFKEYRGQSLLNSTLCNSYVNGILLVIPQIHMLHLMTTSYAQHMALGELYEGLPELIDVVAESLIGQGIMLSMEQSVVAVRDHTEAVKFILDTSDKIHAHFDTIGNHGLTNAVEDIITFTQRIDYKLKRLS